jgi:hypothetical protein
VWCGANARQGLLARSPESGDGPLQFFHEMLLGVGCKSI